MSASRLREVLAFLAASLLLVGPAIASQTDTGSQGTILITNANIFDGRHLPTCCWSSGNPLDDIEHVGHPEPASC